MTARPEKKSCPAALAALLFFFALGRRAEAAAPSARLIYERAEGTETCPDETVVRQAVKARLGFDPFRSDAARTVRADVTRQGEVFRARVRVIDETGTEVGVREIEHASRCEDIVDAMALSIAIAIDPLSLVPASPEPAAPVRPAPPPFMPVYAPPPPSSLKGEAGGTLVGWTGAAPAPSVGGTLYLGIRGKRVGVALEGRGDFPASLDVRLGTVRTSFLGASVVPCVIVGVFRGCAILTMGRLAAEGVGVASPRSDSAFQAMPGLRALVAFPLAGALDLRLGVEGLYSLTPQVLQIDGQAAFRMNQFSAGVAVGLGVHFP